MAPGLLYTTVSRHASIAYVSVHLVHPANFSRERGESTYNEVCQESQRLISEDCVTYIRLTLFIYGGDFSLWSAYSELQPKLDLYRKLVGSDKLSVTIAFMSRDRPSYTSVLMHKIFALRLGVSVCYAEPS